MHDWIPVFDRILETTMGMAKKISNNLYFQIVFLLLFVVLAAEEDKEQ